MEDASKDAESQAKHDEANPESLPSSAGFAERLNILVSVPETIEVELVNSATLDEYEFRAFLASFFSTAVVGILVATIQSGLSFPLGLCGIVFVISCAVCAISAHRKRQQLKQKAKKIRLSG